MNEKLKYSLLRDANDDISIWTRLVLLSDVNIIWFIFFLNKIIFFPFHARHEKRIWFVTLLLGTCMLYSTRTSMPLLLPAVASELRWSKTESGIVLSSFFWGYTVTQVYELQSVKIAFLSLLQNI